MESIPLYCQIFSNLLHYVNVRGEPVPNGGNALKLMENYKRLMESKEHIQS